ncbi:MAG: STAS/SEC14 domain-containing protein [Desulfococcaceae bacterium]|nr:STAS/SEC14 domain-containing protein [Desulfococcaceae bacterium]
MLSILDIGMDKAAAYRVGGKITEDEMKSLLALIREKTEKYGKIFIYQEMESIGGVEPDAMIEKFKFFSEVGISHIRRIAVVTPKQWIRRIVDLEGKIFRHMDMKAFSTEDKQKAIEFLTGSQ